MFRCALRAANRNHRERYRNGGLQHSFAADDSNGQFIELRSLLHVRRRFGSKTVSRTTLKTC